MNRIQFLEDLRKFWEENSVPNISRANARFLRDLIMISGAKNMLEIGTANGLSSICCGIEIEKNKGHILTIDFSPKSHEEAKKNIVSVWLEETIKAVFWNALDIIPTLSNNSYDFVFIDGMMRRSKDFLELSLPKAKTWAIIIIDDVIKFRDKMVGLWEFLEEHNITYNVLPIDWDDGIMMIVKR